jgi:hypothetical protein
MERVTEKVKRQRVQKGNGMVGNNHGKRDGTMAAILTLRQAAL